MGVTHNKSLTLDVTNWFLTLSKEQQHAFIRGCWDGDGNITYKKETNLMQANICSGSLKFITMILNYLDYPNIKITERKAGYIFKSMLNKPNPHNFPTIAKNPLYYIYLSRSKIVDLLVPVYTIGPDDLYMKRKYDTFKEIQMNYVPKHTCSQYYGVRKQKNFNKWISKITIGGKMMHLGNYVNEIDAAIAYDIGIIVSDNNKKLFNFPNNIPEYQKLNLTFEHIQKNQIPQYVGKISNSSPEQKQYKPKKLTSKYIGLYKTHGKYQMLLHYKGRTFCSVGIVNEKEAALIRDKIYYYFKKDTIKLNFPGLVNTYQQQDLEDLSKKYFPHTIQNDAQK